MSLTKKGATQALVLSAFALTGFIGVYLIIDGQNYEKAPQKAAIDFDQKQNTVANVISAIGSGTTSTMAGAIETDETEATTTATTSDEVVDDQPYAENEVADEVVIEIVAETPRKPEIKEVVEVEEVITTTESTTTPEKVGAESPAAGEVDAAASDTQLLEGFPNIYFDTTAKDINKSNRSILNWNVSDDEFECFGNWDEKELSHVGSVELFFNKPGLYKFKVMCEKGSIASSKSTSVLVRDTIAPDYKSDGLGYYHIDSSNGMVLDEDNEDYKGKPSFIQKYSEFEKEGGITYSWQIKNTSKTHLGIGKVVLRVDFSVSNEENFQLFEDVLGSGEALGEMKKRGLEYLGYVENGSEGKTIVFEHTIHPPTVIPGNVSEVFEFNFGDWATSTNVGIHDGKTAWFKVYSNNGSVYLSD